MGVLTIHHADNLKVLAGYPDGHFALIYIDPPFNTGRSQVRTSWKATRVVRGGRVAFNGKRYAQVSTGRRSFDDTFEDYLAFLEPRLVEARRLLSPSGSLFVHLDFREVHYAKVMLDRIFGRASFLNEIIWAYDYGARTSKRWSPKHDNILWYARDPKRYTFNQDAADRVPYMAPGLVGAEKARRGKVPTDTWWHTIVSPTGKEKSGYPAQKPLGILERIVRVHSKRGDRLLDFFAGSGSFGDAADRNDRDCVLVDSSAAAIAVMKRRFKGRNASFLPV